MPDYEVMQGDCISSIAADYGFIPESIWNHANNLALKQKRKDPNVLLPGDIVFIPDKQIKEILCSTDQKHAFKLRAAPTKLRLRLLWGDKPRANERFLLTVRGRQSEGVTDSDGWLEQVISPNAKSGNLLLPETDENYDLQLGHLDPIDEPSGALSRLRNLGFTADGELKGAISAFQKANNLKVTGDLNQTTKDALQAAYGG